MDTNDVYVFPTSFAQQRLWFMDQLEPGSPFYNIPVAVRLTGKLEVSILEQCINEIIQRHETLRTTFSSENGQPIQIISSDGAITLPVINLQYISKSAQESEAQRLVETEARLPFDLSKGPLIRVKLLKLNNDDHIILLTTHHIISDGWSITVLIREMAILYDAFSARLPSPLPELPIQYADYALWQRDRLNGKQLEAQIDYWKNQLWGELPILKLPSDRPRPTIQNFHGASCSIRLSSSLASSLKTFCRSQDVTLYMTLLAAFDVLLYRYSGQDDICVGSPIANRNQAETESLIGFFVNTIVLRADLSGEPTFREFLKRVKGTTLDAYANQDLPFDTVVERLQPDRNLSMNPLFQVMFILQNLPAKSFDLNGLSLSMLDSETGTSTFDLTLSISEMPAGLDASVEYNTDLFDRDTIEQMLVHYQILLEGILTDPDQSISTLPFLTSAEKQRVLIEWNKTTRNFPQVNLTIQELFAAQAAKTPLAEALVWTPPDLPGSTQRVNYKELNSRANQLANFLIKIGVEPEVPVGICIERSIEMVVAVLGVLKAGGAFLPLDPSYPSERLGFMLRDSAVPVLLTQKHLLPNLPAHTAQVICVDDDWPGIAANKDTEPDVKVTPKNLAYLIYTSGSTGQPKGVLVSQSNIVNAYLAWEEAYQLHQVHSHLQMANFAFDVFTGDMVRALCSGGKLVLCPREFLLSPANLLNLMQEEAVDCAEFVPAVLRNLINYLEENAQDLSFMHLLICGSDIWYVEEFRRIQRFCGPQTRLINSFGLTEATIDSSYFDQNEIALPSDSIVPIGRPFANTRMYILDRHLQSLPPLIPGELYVGGAGVTRGYLNRPELTAEKFIKDLYNPDSASLLYKTGDMARFLKDGNIEFLGRMDYQVKIRGFRVEIGEIESVLRNHTAVRDAVVIAACPKRSTNRDQRLVAYLVTDMVIDRIPIQTRCIARKIISNGSGSQEKHTVDLVVTDLSEGGLRLGKVPEDWKTGDELNLELRLPEQNQDINIDGVISWRSEHDAGVAFRTSSWARHKLMHTLYQIRAKTPEMADMLVQDLRRTQTRIPIHANCQVKIDGGEQYCAWVENISRGGLRLVTKGQKWDSGTQLTLEINLPNNGNILDVSGTVWWIRNDWVGIRFDSQPEDQQRIDKVVDELLNEKRFSLTQLRSYLKAKLPEHMIPSGFVLLDSIPLTPNGKVDRKSLPEPDWSHLDIQDHYIAPRTPVEETLVKIWSQILGIEKVGIEDNFFELGGHSLLATQVISRVRDTCQVELPLRRMFEMPNIAALALEIENLQHAQPELEAPPIQRTPRDQALPLSFAQQRLWFLDQLEPDSPFYNIPESLRLTGQLDILILEKAINEIIHRHEILRTTFHTVDGKPTQVISPYMEIRLHVENLETLSPENREESILALAQEEAQKPFNLAQGPLLRAKLLRLSPNDHVILLTLHHIIGDDWSSNIFTNEVSTLYATFLTGRPSPLPELPIQYADYAAWQREYLRGEVLDRQVAYWTKQLAGIPPMLELPTDHPRPAVQSFHGAYQTFTLSRHLSDSLFKICKHEGTSIFMTLLSAFQILLYRYSGQEDICVGTPIANRTRADIENLIGFFVNTLVLRANLYNEPSFRTVLNQVCETCLGAYANQDIPFEKIVDILQPERNLSHSPLFQVMFVIQNTPQHAQELPGLKIRPLEAHSRTSKFDLTLFMLEEEDHLSGAMEFNTDLFDPPTIQRMLFHFEQLLESIVANPDTPIGLLPMLTDAEKQQILEEWNQTQAYYPANLCTHHLIEQQVKETPNAVAVTYRNESLTYQELDQQANQLAHFLISQGVGPDICVGICLERSLEMMVGLLGILKSGGAYVPLDPHYPSERLAFMLEDSGVPILLTQQHLIPELPQTDAKIICLDSNWSDIAVFPNLSPDSQVTPDHMAYLIYTSGSTGKPKGAMIIHRGLVNYLTWCREAYPLDTGYGTPVHSSISFDLTVTSLFPALISGRTVNMLPEDLGVEALGDYVQRVNDNCLIKITPAHLKLIGEQVSPIVAANVTHAFIIGGENLLADHIEFWQKYAPNTQFVNEYGPTETVVGCCVYWAPPGKHTNGVIPIGRPIINTRLYVLDQYQQPVPIGVRGELYIGGVGVARGYLNRPELTAERFLPDPFNPEPGGRMYKTGDLVRWLPDGNLECLGRIDFQVKIRGFRVELGEIESVLAQYPGIKETFVWAQEEGGMKRLVAYFVPQDAAIIPDHINLRDFLKTRLPDYMVPYAFICIDAMPLTPNGKIDRNALPLPDVKTILDRTHQQLPQNAVEQKLVQIWQEVLGLANISTDANFFELGGDSIMSIQVVSRVRQAGFSLTPRLMFEHPTISELAQFIDTDETIQAEQGPIQGDLPLTPIQQWFFNLNLANPNHWNQSILFELDQVLEPQQLEEVVMTMIHQHDVLRLRFYPTENGSWGASFYPVPEKAPIIWQDLSGLSKQEQQKFLERSMEELQQSLDIRDGPLFRIGVFWLGPDLKTRLLMVFHHLIVDGVSWRILMQDIQMAFDQIQQGQPVLRLPKTTSIKSWSQTLVTHAQSDEVQNELPYYLNLTNRIPDRLPLDIHNGTNLESDSKSYSVGLETDETMILVQETAKAYHCDVKTLLLAAWVQALHDWSGQENWQIQLEGHGREDIFPGIDLTRTVGWFTCQYPVQISLQGSQKLVDIVKTVKEALHQIPQNGIGFSLLRNYHSDPQIRNRLRVLDDVEISFNYLGKFDTLQEDGPFQISGEPRGSERDPNNRRTVLWDITGGILGGQLQMELTYSQALFHQETVRKVAHTFLQTLKELISQRDSLGTETITLSDFSEFGWDQSDVEDILGEIDKASSEGHE